MSPWVTKAPSATRSFVDDAAIEVLLGFGLAQHFDTAHCNHRTADLGGRGPIRGRFG